MFDNSDLDLVIGGDTEDCLIIPPHKTYEIVLCKRQSSYLIDIWILCKLILWFFKNLNFFLGEFGNLFYYIPNNLQKACLHNVEKEKASILA